MRVPFLTDEEWGHLRPLLQLDIERIKQHRTNTGMGLTEALATLPFGACEKYFELTGYRETNVNALWHHHLGQYGRECPSCAHLFRTPHASFCAECGWRPGDVRIDWSSLSDLDSFYASVFRQMDAPGWHGTNLDAINDSWVTGGICSTGPPFRFFFRGHSAAAQIDAAIIATIQTIAQDSVAENGGEFAIH